MILLLLIMKRMWVWTLTKNGVYSVKSFYRHLIENGVKYPHFFLWKVKMPPRVNFFMWSTLRNSILTKDNLIRRGWKGDNKCPFCGRDEITSSLLARWHVYFGTF